MNNILTGKQLWLGNAIAMNDKEELTDFINQLREAINQTICSDLQQQRFNIAFRYIDHEVASYYPYVLSLSGRNDDAAQWERYGDGGRGTCISFNTHRLYQILMGMCSNSKWMCSFQEVFYDYDIKKHTHYQRMLEYIHDEKSSIVLDRNNVDAEFERFVSNLIACAFFRKNKSFSAESEIRFAALMIENTGTKFKYGSIDFEYLSGAIKKILKLNLQDFFAKYNLQFADLIDEIIIGPRSPQSEDFLKDYLKALGLDELPARVKKSNCPLR